MKTIWKFRVFGTGHPILEDLGAYIGTFQPLGGVLVFHLFEVPDPAAGKAGAP